MYCLIDNLEDAMDVALEMIKKLSCTDQKDKLYFTAKSYGQAAKLYDIIIILQESRKTFCSSHPIAPCLCVVPLVFYYTADLKN